MNNGKLKNSYIDAMMRKGLSSNEVSFLLALSQYQDERGKIPSVYYRDVCAAMGISIQTFYNMLRSLSLKGLIRPEKENRCDVAVTLIGNDFSDGDYSGGYLRTCAVNYNDARFRRMSGGEKCVFLHMQRFLNGRRTTPEELYGSLAGMMGKSKKTVRGYIRTLSHAGFLQIKMRRNVFHYEMTIKPTRALRVSDIDIPTERSRYEDNIKSLIRCNFRKFLPERGKEKVLEDVAALASQKRSKRFPNIASLIVEAVKESLRIQKAEKREPVLNAAFVNQILTPMIS